jgi:2-aminoadipate transaminase
MDQKGFDINTLLSQGAKLRGAGSTTPSTPWGASSDRADLIDLRVGMPDRETLPSAAFSKHISKILESGNVKALEYEYGSGDPDLKSILSDPSNGFTDHLSTTDQFSFYNGSSGCMEAFCATFVDKGDVVLVEGPSFPGTVRAILRSEGLIVEIGSDLDGASIEEIEEAYLDAVQKGRHIKAFYTIPDFHNPLGRTMSLSRRREIFEFCQDRGILILEDTTYSSLYFESPPPSSIYSISSGVGVLQMGTFSKTIATGLRLGWLHGDANFIEALHKTRSDLGNVPFIQNAVTQFILSGEYGEHITAMRLLYGNKCRNLCNSLDENCGDYIEYQVPAGGFYLWLRILGIDAADLVKQAWEDGLVFPDGNLFFQDPVENDNCIRLAFSGTPKDKLLEVGPILRRSFEKILD